MSSTELTSSSKKPEASQIFRRHSAWRSRSSSAESAISIMLRMPLMGVRISWLIRRRNSVFAVFAFWASSAARASFSLYSCSYSMARSRKRCSTRQREEAMPATAAT